MVKVKLLSPSLWLKNRALRHYIRVCFHQANAKTKGNIFFDLCRYWT